MESSDTEAGMVDCSVGTIVWVRRRNGSWWPGKILGPDELSASHLMSPRSGTPVKLLGREDASVDWYNLEKSKRVKPFRCGEFDDCIERAEASQGMPPKKREKYARREDAILHALELEKQLLEKKYGKLGLSSNGVSTKLAGGLGKEAPTSPELACDNVKHGNSKMDVSLEDKKKSLPLQAQRTEKGGRLGVDDDKSDIRPRMRGLQDIGISPVPSKHKLSSSAVPNGSHKYPPDDGVHARLDGLNPENTISVNSKILSEKRKRPHEGHTEESLSKRRDRRRPLVQVLESSAKLPLVHSSHLQGDGGSAPPLVLGEEKREVLGPAKGGNEADMAVKSDDSLEYKEVLPDQTEISRSKFERFNHVYPDGLSEENTSGSTEDTETDSSGTESMESDSDEAMDGLSDEAEHIELIPKSFGRSEAPGEHASISDEEADDLGLPDDTGESLSTSVTVSKWQLKGKRNNRNLTKRFQNASDNKVPVGFNQEISFKGEGSYGHDDGDTFEKKLRMHTTGYKSRGLDSGREIIKWEDFSWNDQPALKGYWEESAEYYDVLVGRHLGSRMKSMLIDVELKVQSGYQREHVPMISLMSKLNGKAIVGHPIQVEKLEDGSSDVIISAAEESQMESLDSDTTLQPWRTARRTAKCRVPRPPHLSRLDEEEASEQYVDQERKPFGKSSKTRRGPSAKLLKKQPKKISLSSNQKIRTLSSIGTQQQQQQKYNNDLVKGQRERERGDVDGLGLIKPESLPTAVACIPVKLVFSRLHEELGTRHQ